MATARDILIEGVARSGKMRNQQLATESTELLKRIRRASRTLFAMAARVNPYYFGKELPVVFSSGGWTWPTDMNLLCAIEIGQALGTECIIVPRDQRNAEPSKPAVYAFGPKLYTAGNPLDPTSGNLVFVYSRSALVPATLDDDIDPGIPEDHTDILANDLAAYLATKDGRPDDRAAFIDEYGAAVALFLAHIEHATATIERRKYGQIRRFNLQTLLPVGSPVTGGVAG